MEGKVHVRKPDWINYSGTSVKGRQYVTARQRPTGYSAGVCQWQDTGSWTGWLNP